YPTPVLWSTFGQMPGQRTCHLDPPRRLGLRFALLNSPGASCAIKPGAGTACARRLPRDRHGSQQSGGSPFTPRGAREMAKTTGDVIVEKLIDWGVDTAFGLPGDGINGIFEALGKNKDKIRMPRR